MISVIMPTYNASALVERAIRSVYEQAVDESIELLVIDDASTDDTVAIVRRLSYPGIRIIQFEVNQGAGAARQAGIREAKGRYLAFLDADDYWRMGFLQKTSKFLDDHSEVVAVSVGQEHRAVGNKLIILPMFCEHPDKFPVTMIVEDFFDFWATYKQICTGSALMRTKVAQEAGGMRVDLRVTEDLEFWGLIATYGKWGMINEILFVSDGLSVPSRTSWLEKSVPRWRNAPSVAEWERRIVARLQERELVSFRKIRGWLAGTLAYFMILSSRDELARQEVRSFGKWFTHDKMSLLLRVGALNGMLWKIACRFLRKREYAREI